MAKKWLTTRPWARKAERKRSLTSGQALINHCRGAHKGLFSPECRGCRELLRKMKEG